MNQSKPHDNIKYEATKAEGGADINPAEFEQFLEVYERDLYSFCRYLANNNDTASDLYQETALAAFQMAGRIDRGKNPKAFLFAIAVGKWKNIRKKAAGRQRIAPEMPLEDAYNTAPLSAGDTLPEAVLEKSQMRESIRRALSGMKDKFRIPLILYYFDECPTETIAAILKIPQGTVKSRLHKGRSLMKEALEKEGYQYGG